MYTMELINNTWAVTVDKETWVQDQTGPSHTERSSHREGADKEAVVGQDQTTRYIQSQERSPGAGGGGQLC